MDKEKQQLIYAIIGIILLLNEHRESSGMFNRWIDLSLRLMEIDIETIRLFYDDLIKMTEATKAKDGLSRNAD